MASLSAEERETIIVISDASDTAVIVTHSRPWLSALEKNPAATQVGDADPFGGKTFHIDKRFVSKPRNGPRKRTETPEQVAARMAKARQSRQGGK